MDCNELAPDEHAMYAAFSAKLSRAVENRSNVTLQRAGEALGLSYADARTVFEGLEDAGIASRDADGHVSLRAGACPHAGMRVASSKPLAFRSFESNSNLPSGDPRGRAGGAPQAEEASLPGDLAEVQRAVKRPTRVAAPRAPRRRDDPNDLPKDVEVWNAGHFATYFAQRINPASHFGYGAGDTNFDALRKWFAEWRRNGVPQPIIKAMIDVFAANSKRYMRRDRPAWRSFLAQKNAVLEEAEKLYQLEGVEASRGDRARWLDF